MLAFIGLGLPGVGLMLAFIGLGLPGVGLMLAFIGLVLVGYWFMYGLAVSLRSTPSLVKNFVCFHVSLISSVVQVVSRPKNPWFIRGNKGIHL